MNYRPLFSVLALLFPVFAWCTSSLACSPIPQPSYNASTYYQSTNGLSGAALKPALNLVIRDHQDYSYTPCMWDMLRQADEDPNDANSVIAYYTQRSILKANRDQGGNTPDYWNREHIWPNSHGFSSREQHAYRDGHALVACDKSVNADRGSKDFAEGGSPHLECTACNQTASTWEPPDDLKGDTARMMFYMDVRYEGGDDSGVPDLSLVDNLTSSGQPQMGDLCDLVQWHVDDPVSTRETLRNDVIYSWQGNRNPFVDHPDFALHIWGPQCGFSIPDPVIEPEQVPNPYWMMLVLGPIILLLGFWSKKRHFKL
ncbi:MAG: endonuclease [Pseudomonadales bacterium]|nr:endonuclease [Pseudomonadales bacterium]